jgi:hypothetical protein
MGVKEGAVLLLDLILPAGVLALTVEATSIVSIAGLFRP